MSTDDPATSSAGSDDRLFLGVLGGAERSVEIPSAGALTIGRGRDCDLRVIDPLVSRRHALVHGGAPPMFEELGSKNASLLLRGAIVERATAARRIALTSGDVLKLGGQLVGVHRGGAAVTRLLPDAEAFEARLARTCAAAGPFAVIRIQLAQTRSADLAKAALYALITIAQGVAYGVLGIHELSLLVEGPPAAAELEVQHLATQLSELGVQGVVGLAVYPRDGSTAAALLATASAEVETIRAWAPSTPIASGVAAARRRPAPLTSFIGRDAELEQIQLRLAGGSRLLTIAGPPGVGKTRLALRHAEGCGGQTIVYCDLAASHGLAEACRALAQALELPSERGAGPEAIARSLVLRGAGALVVLDNVEQVVGELRELLALWLADARTPCVLLTSREVLGLAGEDSFELGPLALPVSDDDFDAEAVRLFCDRGQMMRGGVAPAVDAHVVALVRLLDGMPLALELAAGCLDVYGPAELCARLPARLDELVDRRRTPGSRHHSLRGTLDPSWALLTIDEQAVLVACCVFEGGCSLAAIEAVAPVGSGGAPTAQVVASLRRKSWIRGLEAGMGSGRRRFELYRSIHAYAEASPGAQDVRAAAARRHVGYFAALAREALEPGATGARELELELANLRAAHRHALALAEIDAALAIAVGMAYVADGQHAEVQALVEVTVACAVGQPHDPRLALRARIVAARARHVLGAETRPELDAVVAAARALGDAGLEGIALAALARVVAATDPNAAAPLFEAALAGVRAAGDLRAVAATEIDYASVRLALDDIAGARRLLDEAARGAERIADRALGVTAATQLGNLLLATGRLGEAERMLRDAIAEAGAIGAARAEAHASRVFALLLQESEGERAREAEAYYARAADMFGRLDDRVSLAHAVVAMGTLRHEHGDLAAARERYHEATAQLSRANARVSLMVAQCALGSVLADLDELEAADALFAQVLADPVAPPTERHAWLRALSFAHADAARARCAERDGNEEAAQFWHSRAAATLAPAGSLRAGPSVRCAQRMLARMLPRLEPALPGAAPPAPTMFIARGARSLVLPTGERVDLMRHTSLRLIVLALASRRRDERDRGLTNDELLACGWPGERVDAMSGNARVRVALSRLRSLGLRAWLIRAEDGYVLAPALAITLEE